MQRKDSCILDSHPLMLELKNKLMNSAENNAYGSKVAQLLETQSSTDLETIHGALKKALACAVDYLDKWVEFDGESGQQRRDLHEKLNILYSTRHPSGRNVLSLILPTVSDVLEISSQLHLNLNAGNVVIDLRELNAAVSQMDVAELKLMTVAERWRIILQASPECTEILKLMSFILSLPLSSASAERTFSYMQYAYRDERRSLSPAMLQSELLIKHNLQDISCEEFQQLIATDYELLRHIADSTKYPKEKTAHATINSTDIFPARERAAINSGK